MSALQRILLVPDCHVPYEDSKAFAVMLAAGRALKPDIIILLGDFADFYAVSSHSKNPNRAADLQYEVDRVRDRLKALKRLGAKRNIYVAGNHEDRLERYLMDKAPALFNAVTIPDVLGLEPLGFEYVPYKQYTQVGKLYVTHDTGTAGQYAHYKAQAAFEGNVIIGHTHRMGYAIIGTVEGRPHVGAMLGWLGDFKHIDYMHAAKARRDWAHGFGIGYMEPSGTVHVQPVPIIANRCIVAGQLVFDKR